MKKIDKMKLKNRILTSKKFQRMAQVSMSLDYSLNKDYAENRMSHSIKVANATELMALDIGDKINMDLDPENLFYFVGLLHDVGHTAFSHEGERVLNKYTKKYSNGEIFFDGNSNNYETIKKNNLLENLSPSDEEYILASLAKHPETLYVSQKRIRDMIDKQTFLESKFFNFSKNDKTLACQIMDIADENCYIVSDIVDAENILTKQEIERIFDNIKDKNIKKILITSLYKGKTSLIDSLNNLFEQFCLNFTLKDGLVIAENVNLEAVRQDLMKGIYDNIIKHEKIRDIRDKNIKIMKKVFEYFFETKDIQSKYYQSEYRKASNNIAKVEVIRNMLGGLTDKSIKKIYRQIQ